MHCNKADIFALRPILEKNETLEMESSETQKVRFLSEMSPYFSSIGSRRLKVIKQRCGKLMLAMI